MKAVQFGHFGERDVLEYIDVATPEPKNDDLLIEVTAAGVNFVDIRERMGIYGRAETHVGHIELPHISGLQAVGTVVEVGPSGDRSRVGAKVMSYLPAGGGYAQFAVAPAKLSVQLPTSIDETAMAALPTQGLTSYLMLTACTQLRPGESVLVQGASGGVGSIAVQIAKILGAGLVLGTAGSEEKRQFVRSIGADFAVDYNRPDWPMDVLGKTGGRGVDILLESIGGEIFEQNFECLATFGRYIIFGSTRGPGKPFEPRRLMKKSQSMTGIYLPVYLAKPDLLQEALQFFVEQVANGKLRPQVSQTLPLSQAAEAHRLLEEQKIVGTIVLNPKK